MHQRRRILACVASPLEKENVCCVSCCAEVDACFKAIDIAMIMQVMNTITTAIGIASMIKNDDDYDDADAV